MSHSSRGPRLGIFTTSVDDPFVVKSCAPSTPGLTSPGPFSSPNMAFSSEFERCDTPSSATSFDIQQSESRFGKIGSSPDPFWLRQLPTATKQQQSQHTTLGLDLKMETRSDLADDDSDIEPATTSLQRAKSNVTTSSVSGAGDADLALAQLLLDFRDGPQRSRATSNFIASLSDRPHTACSTPSKPRASPVLVPKTPSERTQRDPSTLPLGPAFTSPTNSISVLSDLTPLRLSPPPKSSEAHETPTRAGSSRRGKRKAVPAKRERGKATAVVKQPNIEVDENEPLPSSTAPRTSRKRANGSSTAASNRPSKRRATALTVVASEVENVDILGLAQSAVTELEGFLVETLALSRLSSMTASQLVTAVLAEQSHLRDERPEVEWLDIFSKILHGLSVFGCIHRSGKDAKGTALEDQFYYQIERDRADRAVIWQDVVRSKRTTTKRDDVQYYWRPVRALVKRW